MNPIAMNLLVYGPDMNESVLSELAFIHEVGYQGVEIPVFNVDLAHWSAWKKEVDRLGLQPFACAIAGPTENLISPDPAVRAAGIAYLKGAVDVAAYLGAPYLSGPFHSALGVFTGAKATQQEIDWSIAGIREVADHAATKNITLCLEYLNRFESYLVSCADELYALLEQINHPYVEIMFDTFHANIEEVSTAEAIRRIAKRTPHIQLSESTRGILGEGQVNWPAVLQSIKDINYAGWLVVEAFSEKLPAAHIWRKMFNSERELVEKSYQFLITNYEKI